MRITVLAWTLLLFSSSIVQAQNFFGIDDFYSIDNDIILRANVLDNDVKKGNALQVKNFGSFQLENGDLVLNPDGSFRFTPKEDFIGKQSYRYEYCDSENNCQFSVLNIIVSNPNNQNNRPTVADDYYNAYEESIKAFNVLRNDADPEGQPLTFSIVEDVDPNLGTTQIQDRAILFIPAANITGEVKLTYEACDSQGLCNEAILTIFLININDRPEASDDEVTVGFNSSVVVDVLENDVDVDQDALTTRIKSTLPSSIGTLALEGQKIRFTPSIGMTGEVEIKYEACDPTMSCSTATLTVTVVDENIAPVAVEDEFTIENLITESLPVLENDTDINDNIDITSIKISTFPQNGTATANRNGTISYNASADFSGTDFLSYTVKDAQGLESNVASVIIGVNQGNRSPIANNDIITISKNSSIQFNLLGNDTDPDDNIDLGSLTLVSRPNNGSISVFNNGFIAYTPNRNFSGPDSFQYSIKDEVGLTSNIATVFVNVIGGEINAPVASDDNYILPMNVTAFLDVLENDVDANNNINSGSIQIQSQPASGFVSTTNNGTISYRPFLNFTGIDSFTYTVNDEDGLSSNLATVRVQVNQNLNQAPRAVNDSFTLFEDGPELLNVLGNDVDADNNINPTSINIIENPTTGTITRNNVGALTYSPPANFNGNDSFRYTVSDRDGNTSNIATVNINVQAVNDAPVAVNDEATTEEETSVTVDVLENDQDIDGDQLIARVQQVIPIEAGSAIKSDSEQVIFTPFDGFTGTVQIEYEACDPTLVCDQAVLTINVTNVADAPVAVNDILTYQANTSTTLFVLGNDQDPENDIDPGSVEIESDPTNGEVTVSNNGSVIYTPNDNFYGEDAFTYSVADQSQLRSNIATVSLTNTGNNNPIAVNDIFNVAQGSTSSFNVVQNDSDPDNDLSSDGLIIRTRPNRGTLSIQDNNGLVYEAPSNFTGPTSFTYQIEDEQGNRSNTATAFINIVNQQNQNAPVAVTDNYSIAANTSRDLDILANDLDAENNINPGSIAIVSQPNNGSVTLTNGLLRFTPDNDFTGAVALTYTVSDSTGLVSNAGTVRITVTENQGNTPVAVNDAVSGFEDNSIEISVLDNDRDPDNNINVSSVNLTTQPSNGAVVVDNQGVITYTPNANFAGNDGFNYTFQDADGLTSNQAFVSITVQGVNDAPVAADDEASTPEETQIDLLVLENDTDLDDNNLVARIKSIENPAAGTLQIFGNSQVRFTPATDFTGVFTFVYEACDNDFLCDSATVNVTVTNVNDAPIAVADTAIVSSGETLTIQVLDNDIDPDNNLRRNSVTIVDQPQSGNALTTNEGTIIYDQNDGFIGTDQLTYQVSDQDGEISNVATVLIKNDGENAPVAVDDVYNVSPGSTTNLNVVANDIDVDNDINPDGLIIRLRPSRGTLEILDNNLLRYTAPANFTGPTSFQYTISDLNGAVSNRATVFINIIDPAQSNAPIAVDDNFAIGQNATTVFNLIANDIDAEENINPATIDVESGPGNGTIQINNDGTVTYIPAFNFVGADQFQYTIIDSTNLISNLGTVRITIAENMGENPVAVNDEVIAFEDEDNIIFVLNNDTDNDDNLNPSSINITRQANNGTIATDVNGSIIYTPNSDFTGTDNFKYVVQDNDGLVSNEAFVSIEVRNVNDKPVAMDDLTVEVNEEETIDIDVLDNDTDVDGDALQIRIVSIENEEAGVIAIRDDQRIRFEGAMNFSGPVLVTYEACDPSLACDTAEVLITVINLNDAPITLADTLILAEGGINTIDVLENDVDLEDNLDRSTLTIVAQPANGTVSINNDGTVTYTPLNGFFGADSFSYQVSDTEGLTSNETTVSILNSGENTPVAVNDVFNVVPGSTTSLNVILNDLDPDGDIDPQGLVIRLRPSQGTLEVQDNNGLTYIAPSDFTGPTSFSYTIRDLGGRVSNQATVFINVVDPNNGNAPLAVDDNYSIASNATQSLMVLKNDIDADNNINVSLIAIEVEPNFGTVTVNEDGTISYTPQLDYVGDDQFKYTVTDSTNLISNIATVNINIRDNQGNNPLAVNDEFLAFEDEANALDILSNDNDTDSNLNPGSVNITSQPTNGTITILSTGIVIYTPTENFVGQDNFSYTVQDNDALISNQAFVSIEVQNQNDRPIVLADTVSAIEDETVVFDVLENDFDIDGDDLMVRIKSDLENPQGTLSLLADQTIEFVPNENFDGTFTFVYEACDPTLTCDTAIVTINFENINDAPITAADSVLYTSEQSVNINVLENDIDLEGNLDPSTLVIIDRPVEGTFVLLGDGLLEYTPAADFFGNDSLTYQVSDLEGLTSQITTVKFINSGNNAPQTFPDVFNVEPGETGAFNVLANDFDPDENIDFTSIEILSQPEHGTITINQNGIISFTAEEDFLGADQFSYQVRDLSGLISEEAIVFVNIKGFQNNPPFAGNNTYFITQNATSRLQILNNDIDADGNINPASIELISNVRRGQLTLETTGQAVYVPNREYIGPDGFTYVVRDSTGLVSNIATVSIEIRANSSSVPVAVDDDYQVFEEVVTDLNVTGNDTDEDSNIDSGSINLVQLPSFGVATVEGGVIKYLSNIDYVGEDILSYVVSDTDGIASNVATVKITINNINDQPTVVDDVANTLEENAVAVSVLNNDFDVDGDELTVRLINGSIPDSVGIALVDNFGRIVFEPAIDFIGSVTIPYEACDQAQSCGSGELVVTVTNENDAPTAVDDLIIGVEDQILNFDVLENDFDQDGDALSILTFTQAENGFVMQAANGQFQYFPDINFSGEDKFNYTVTDASNTIATAQVIIQISPVNDNPISEDQFLQIDEDTPLNSSAFIGVEDPDGDQLILNTIPIQAPSHGTLTLRTNGTLIYVPEPEYSGLDTLIYEVCDNGFPKLCTQVFTLINVTPINDAPVTTNDSYTLDEDTILEGNFALNDFDPEGDLIRVDTTAVDPPFNGSIRIRSDGLFIYTPNPDFFGTDFFNYRICDSAIPAACSFGTVFIEVLPVNDPPRVVNADGIQVDTVKFTLIENETMDFCLDAVDPEGDNFRLSGLVTSAALGTALINPASPDCFTYTPADHFVGTEYLVATICDDVIDFQCDEVVVEIEVLPSEETELYEAITPNGDGFNDMWFITGISKFPNNHVDIYNRYGGLVYAIDGYDNFDQAWDGRSNQSNTFMNNNGLPEGAYFYVIDLGDGSKPRSGYIMLKRN